MNILFPGRHLAMTRMQEQYLAQILNGRTNDHTALDTPETLDSIIFAITSANLDTSRYSPINEATRVRMVDRFGSYLQQNFGTDFRIVSVPHFPQNPRFAEFVINEAREQTEGELKITPENTTVLCSTPAVAQLYKDLGFSILECENTFEKPYFPIQIIKTIATKDNWKDVVRSKIHPTSFSVLNSTPEVINRIKRLHNDPVLTDSGDLTENRDYNTYAMGMSNPTILEIKYNELKPFIKEGKIVDEGCADSALLQRIAKDFCDSDLIGVEITGAFINMCRHAQQQGAFGRSYVHFHQRNILQPVFEPESVDTILCNSTLHELWSYDAQQKSIDTYLQRVHKELRNGGVLAIRDVVGPENKDQQVYMLLNSTNGSNDQSLKECQSKAELKQHLEGLSTLATFYRFAQDYLKDMRANGREDAKYQWEEETIDGQTYIKTTLKNATEFMTKFMYTDNWSSEMNEEFAFKSLSEWKQQLNNSGFHIIEDSLRPQKGSHDYTSPYTKKHFWDGNITLYNTQLEQIPYPVTNMILVGIKEKDTKN